eukprot:Pgem_evm1s9225
MNQSSHNVNYKSGVNFPSQLSSQFNYDNEYYKKKCNQLELELEKQKNTFQQEYQRKHQELERVNEKCSLLEKEVQIKEENIFHLKGVQ